MFIKFISMNQFYNIGEILSKLNNLGGGGGINPLALLIAPLVGISLLTAAVAVALNPVLVSVSLTGKRRKRSDDQVNSLDVGDQQKFHEMKVNNKHILKRQSVGHGTVGRAVASDTRRPGFDSSHC